MQSLSDEQLIELRRYATRYCLLNYDYCYLSAMHHKNKLDGTDTLIVGSSHAMNGVVEECFERRPINFSISSQDIFYAYEHIKKAVKEGKRKIENCIIDLGYYVLYQDVSRSKNIGKALIPRVYVPLFGEPHHYSESTDYDMLQMLSYDETKYSKELVQEVCSQWAQADMLKEPTFYGNRRSRERNSRCFLEGKIWNSLSEEEREQIAVARTTNHNYLRKYEATRTENIAIMQEMTKFLTEQSVRVIFVIFPFTDYYNMYIDSMYKAEIYDLLDGFEYPVEFLDMNEFQMFDNQDFVDADHLNYQGAEKASRILNAFLNM